jgi:hypothetical protein
MIIVMVVLMIGLALGAVAVAESLDSRVLGNRNAQTSRALQAADAGVQAVLYQQAETNVENMNLNGGLLGLGSFLDCIEPQFNASLQVTGVTQVAANTAGVCPVQTTASGGGTSTTLIPSVPIGDHASYQAEFIPGAKFPFGTTSERVDYPEIVALGTDTTGGKTVYRRELVYLQPIAPLQALEARGKLQIFGVSLAGISAAATVNGNVQAGTELDTPATLTLAALNGLSLLGTATYGTTWSGGLVVGNQPVKTTQQIIRSPISIASTKSSCPSTAACTALGAAYSSSTNTFSLSSGSVTFQPGDYVFCSFNATGGTVNVSPTSTSPVRIFIDNPTSARCNSATTNAALNQYNDQADVNRGNFIANNGITNGLLSTGGLTGASGLQIYVVGDGNGYDDNTKVSLGGSATCLLQLLGVCTSISPVTQGMIVYAPTSKVTLNTGVCLISGVLCTGGVFEGSLIGNDVSSTATVFTQDLDLGNYPLYTGVAIYHPQQFLQCSKSNSSGAAVTSLTGNATTDTSGC